MKLNQVIIGLEIHLELKTKSKMFCGCSVDSFGKEPNTFTCPVCLGLPGALPVPNSKAIEMAIMIGKALNCQTSKKSQFDRKNYFYPDLPKGYQISQHEFNLPFSTNGWVKIPSHSILKTIGIRRVHLEEDTGKSLHSLVDGDKATLLDFNKSGIPLVEIVSEPDLQSPEEAVSYCEKVRKIILHLGLSDCDLEKGQMRFEPTINLLVEKEGREFFTPLVEIKNINSFRFLRKALDFEIDRQFRLFEKDGVIKTSGNKITRGYDQEKMVTFEQRHKEEAEEYRYFPEPDIPPFEWSEDDLTCFKRQFFLIEGLEVTEKRFKTKYHLNESQITFLTEDKSRVDYFEEAVRLGIKYQIPAEYIANVIVNKRINIQNLSPSEFVAKIGESKTKFILGEKEISSFAEEIIKDNPQVVDDYKKGKIQVIGFLIGLVQRKAEGKADPKLTKEVLLSLLEK